MNAFSAFPIGFVKDFKMNFYERRNIPIIDAYAINSINIFNENDYLILN